MPMPGRYRDTTWSRMGYNGQAKDDEVYGKGNLNSALFWEYDTRLGPNGRWNPDPIINPSVSTYATFDGNPIWKSDVLGNSPDNFVFNEKGSYVRTEKNNQPDKLVIENTNTRSRTFYEFNDPIPDVKAIKNGIASKGAVGITGVEILSDTKVESQIEKSGVSSTQAQQFPYSYAKDQGAAKMDYGVNGIRSGDLDPKKFYIREGTAYNVGDIGNYLWGRGMATLGIPLSTAKLGAHWNNMFNGQKQQTSLYDFGSGTYGKPTLFDSPGDQRAIRNGYVNSPIGIKQLRDQIDQIHLMNNLMDKYGPKY